MKKALSCLTVCLLACLSISAQAANNFHLVDSDANTGFKLFRTSRPSKSDVAHFCKLGIQEVLVMSGDADAHELKFAPEVCPNGLKVIYNVKQNYRVPLDEGFLNFFDTWVQEAREKGKKIAFRCIMGAHRTGRLAAYYQIKYQGLTAEDANLIMNEYGSFMWFGGHRHIKYQVRSMEDFIAKAPCSQKSHYCIQTSIK